MGDSTLPAGWTQHLAPTGHIYFYNAQTQESTYTRPAPPKKKKEKPLKKTPILGTEWIRVLTTEGNTFYNHRVDKSSVWTVPEEIKVQVEELEEEERKEAEMARLNDDQEHSRKKEGEQWKAKASVPSQLATDSGKRKAEQVEEPVEEVVITKKARLDEQDDSDQGDDSDESEEEEWQREAAVQLAKEAEEERQRQEEEAQRAKEEAAAELKAQETAKLQVPDRVDLSLEEGKALFKTLLREKDINPLHPWDTSLPLFVSDPRYVLLPSVSARRDAFDEYCRERARELRQNAVKKEKEESDPKVEYDALLQEQVKSTRTSWTDFRRTWKKDRRFYSFGRDDRDREKRFKDFLRELGERKRAAARKAEAEFFQLLKEKGNVTSGSLWKDIKRSKDLYNDPRYDAVGSSSLREELFNSFLKAGISNALSGEDSSDASNDKEKEKDADLSKKERKEKAMREREEKVKSERGRIQSDINRSKTSLTKEEGERAFRVLLVDAVREPQATWESVQEELRIDPRYRNSPLSLNQQLHLFHAHLLHLRGKHYDALLQLFEKHAPALDTRFNSLPVGDLMDSTPVTKLGLGIDELETEFKKWQRERNTKARTAFDEMLGENSFVEFWGRLGKIGGEGVHGGVKAEEEEEEEEGEKVDMKELAKKVNVQEIVRVIANDKRYLVFDHIPEQREQWIRDYLSQLSAPTMSVHRPPQ